MDKQQTAAPAALSSPVRVLRIENPARDPYVFGVKDIRRVDQNEERQPAGGADEATPGTPNPAPSLNVYEVVNCTR